MVQGFNNDTFLSTDISLTNSSSGEWIAINDGTDTFGIYNSHGTPESSVTANIGSLSTDTTNGQLYIKQSDSVNTGWSQISNYVVQQQRTLKQDFTRYTGNFTNDDSIPQNTEGSEVFTVSITPTNSSNVLVVRCLMTFGSTAGSSPALALFQDSTADALAVSWTTSPSTDSTLQIYLIYPMVAGTTSSTTFKINIGNVGSSISYDVNGRNNARVLGGVLTSYLDVTEYTS